MVRWRVAVQRDGEAVESGDHMRNSPRPAVEQQERGQRQTSISEVDP